MPKYICQSLNNNQFMLSEMPSLSDGMVLSSSSNGSKWYDNDMPVYWINSHQMGHLWFSGWIVEEPFMYAIVLVFLFCLCIFSQFLYWFITKKFDFMKKSQKPQGEEYAYLEGRSAANNSKAKELALKALVYVAKIVAYAMHTALSGLLMLAIMKYNVGVFLVLIAGNTIGWSIFSLLFGNAEVKQECH